MKSIFFTLLFISFLPSFGQQDSTEVLSEITVKAFESNRAITEVAAPVHLLGPKLIERFDNDGILPILNNYPGIRMEERSPGSYRISIRGSSVRSPFGVRNVKVYWNDIPFTDANGISYFNLLDINSIGSVEILKGPSGSIYGAGMGGVILLENKAAKVQNKKRNMLSLNTHLGSYNTQNRSLSFSSASEKTNTYLAYSHAGTDGYRDHSRLRRDVLNYRTSLFLTDKYTINLIGTYADLNYQTPGGLNFEQKENNPKDARLATRFTPSSEEQKAAIHQKVVSIGVSQEFKYTERISSVISLFGNSSNLKNPFITNYEERTQKSFGARNKNIFKLGGEQIKSKAVLGFEYQQTNSVFDVYDNNAGTPGNNQFKETVDAFQSSIFGQIEIEFPSNIFLTGGLSLNQQMFNYERIAGIAVKNETSGVPLMPRISVLKSFGKPFSVFASIGQGFSPPTVQEFVTIFHPLALIAKLNAEVGTNYELGIKGGGKKFSYQANAYSLQLNDAIIRGSIGEEDVFTNAGKASQTGFELLVEYQETFANNSRLQTLFSADLKDYTYLSFIDNENVFDGNNIPSVPDKTFNFTIDYALANGLFWNNNLNFTSEIPLNNANTIFSNAYYLLNSRIGWKKDINQWGLRVYMGGNNLLDQSYSLGNDINAFGSRYFNPSAPRNWNGGIALNLRF
ncbi:MAG: iron complex outermembrane receptor protein [Arcticibacterium sp.]|jgi:iron complex outermembrane receptor protein